MSNQDDNAQDLHLSVPARPDMNWARMQPMNVQPSKERLDRKHQLVQVKNTSDSTVTNRGLPLPQKHIVIDRYNQGHELEPGETKEVDMLVDDIEHFIRERKPNRMDHQNRFKAMHPIQIIGFESTARDEDQAREQQPAPQRTIGRERSVKAE